MINQHVALLHVRISAPAAMPARSPFWG
jgi:hypothetical protein